MIRLRLATEAGIQEITPASLTHCAGCEQEYYLDGPAGCEVYDRRTDRCRLPECIRATNPVIVEGMRLQARHAVYGNTVVVPFPRSADRRSSLTRPRLSCARRCAFRRQSANATRMASSGRRYCQARSPSARSALRAGKWTCAACWQVSYSTPDAGASWQTSLTHICRQSARSICCIGFLDFPSMSLGRPTL